MVISCSDRLSAQRASTLATKNSWIGTKAKTKKYRRASDFTFERHVSNCQHTAPGVLFDVWNKHVLAIGIQFKLDRRARARNLEHGKPNTGKLSNCRQGLAALTRLEGIDLVREGIPNAQECCGEPNLVGWRWASFERHEEMRRHRFGQVGKTILRCPRLRYVLGGDL